MHPNLHYVSGDRSALSRYQVCYRSEDAPERHAAALDAAFLGDSNNNCPLADGIIEYRIQSREATIYINN